jgi:hypothetical protein
VQAYCRAEPADLYTAVEADRFAGFVGQRIACGTLRVRWLDEVLAFEHAMVRASLWGRGTTLRWSVDPVRLFEALEAGQPTDTLPHVRLEMVVDVGE